MAKEENKGMVIMYEGKAGLHIVLQQIHVKEVQKTKEVKGTGAAKVSRMPVLHPIYDFVSHTQHVELVIHNGYC